MSANKIKLGPIQISQMELVAWIGLHLDKLYGPLPTRPRQINAIIAAANIIVDAFASGERPVIDGMGIFEWLRSDHVGDSSDFMCWILSRLGNHTEYAYPRDPDDFNRCLGLLRAEPRLRADLDKMSDTGKEWAALVAHWDELEAMYSATDDRLYERMQELYQ